MTKPQPKSTRTVTGHVTQITRRTSPSIPIYSDDCEVALDDDLYVVPPAAAPGSVWLVSIASVEKAVREWVAIANTDIRTGWGEMDGQVSAVEINPDKAVQSIVSRLTNLSNR